MSAFVRYGSYKINKSSQRNNNFSDLPIDTLPPGNSSQTKENGTILDAGSW